MKKFFAVLAMLSASMTAIAGNGTVNADNVNLRSGAGLTNPVVGTLKNGEKVTILRVAGSWLELKAPESLKVYVNEARINRDGTLNGELNMRTRMSSSAPCLGTLPKGTKVERLDKRANGWVQIKVPAGAGVKVYAAAFLISYDPAAFDEKGLPVQEKKVEAPAKEEKKVEAPAVTPAPTPAKTEKKAEEKPAEITPAPDEKVELQGILIKWKYSSSPDTAYALLTAPDGFNQAFVKCSDQQLLDRAENKLVKITGTSAGRFGKNGAMILKADVIAIL